MENEQNECCNPNVKFNPKSSHTTRNLYGLLNSPEVFILNLAWFAEPVPSEILRILVSLPD
jgi:hypothetical protein